MLNDADIGELTQRIVREFDPDKVLLFGSRAAGTARADSDVDLLVILPFDGSSFHKSLDILNRIAAPGGVDLIARTQSDTDRRYQEFDPFIRSALDSARVLYERDHARAA